MRALFLAMALGIGVPLSCSAIAGENAVPVPGDKLEAVGGLQLLLEKKVTWDYWGMAGGAKVHVSATKPLDDQGEMTGLNIKPLDRKAVIVFFSPALTLKNVGSAPARLALSEVFTYGGPGWQIVLRAVGPDGKEVPVKKRPEPAAPAPKVSERPPVKTLEPGKDWKPPCGQLFDALDFPSPGKYTVWVELIIDLVPGDDKAWSGTLRSNRMEWEVRKAEGQDAAPTK